MASLTYPYSANDSWRTLCWGKQPLELLSSPFILAILVTDRCSTQKYGDSGNSVTQPPEVKKNVEPIGAIERPKYFSWFRCLGRESKSQKGSSDPFSGDIEFAEIMVIKIYRQALFVFTLATAFYIRRNRHSKVCNKYTQDLLPCNLPGRAHWFDSHHKMVVSHQ